MRRFDARSVAALVMTSPPLAGGNDATALVTVFTNPYPNMPNYNQMMLDVFQRHPNLVIFEFNRRLADLYPGEHVLFTRDYNFDLKGFCQDGKCGAWVIEDLHPLICAEWFGREKEVRKESSMPSQRYCGMATISSV